MNSKRKLSVVTDVDTRPRQGAWAFFIWYALSMMAVAALGMGAIYFLTR